jgi:hypothetical protein
MDPNFLQNPDAVDIWIQHFDSTRGIPICIVDLPPVQSSSISLWRRLLLGEGDGFGPNAVRYTSTRQSIDLITHLDMESKYYKEEKLAATDDESTIP